MFSSCNFANKNPEEELFKNVDISNNKEKIQQEETITNSVDLYELSLENLQGTWVCYDFKILSGNFDPGMEEKVKASTKGMSFTFNGEFCTLKMNDLSGVYKPVLKLDETPQSLELHPFSGLLKFPAKYVIAEYSHNKMIFEETRQGTVYHTILGRK